MRLYGDMCCWVIVRFDAANPSYACFVLCLNTVYASAPIANNFFHGKTSEVTIGGLKVDLKNGSVGCRFLPYWFEHSFIICR
jgi:hypothetical protein